MRKIDKSEKLDKAIAILEAKQKKEFIELKSQAQQFTDSLKPKNLINQSIQSFLPSSEEKKDMLKSLAILALGYVSKKVFLNSSHSSSWLKKGIDYAVQFFSKKV